MTDTGTVTLTEFLLARIAEDEAVGQREDDVEWSVGQGIRLSTIGEGMDSARVITIHSARVLAECEAKRRIVELHGDREEQHYTLSVALGRLTQKQADYWLSKSTRCCSNCSNYEDDVPRDECPTLRLLALPYAGHPDYRQEWAP